MTAEWTTPEPLVEALSAVLDAQHREYHPQSDETFVQCLVCGEWEGHDDSCPVPAIENWARK